MAKSIRKPAARRKRPYRARRKKGRRVLLGTIGFVVIVALSLSVLQYINKKIVRDEKKVRITEEELNQKIEGIDERLNKIFSEIGLKKSEIVAKKSNWKKEGDIRWQYKEVSIKTDQTRKVEEFNDKFFKLS